MTILVMFTPDHVIPLGGKKVKWFSVVSSLRQQVAFQMTLVISTAMRIIIKSNHGNIITIN